MLHFFVVFVEFAKCLNKFKDNTYILQLIVPSLLIKLRKFSIKLYKSFPLDYCDLGKLYAYAVRAVDKG